MKISGRMVTPGGVVEGSLSIVDGRIAGIRKGKGEDRWILPGFVDIHTHGGGGGLAEPCIFYVGISPNADWVLGLCW